MGESFTKLICRLHLLQGEAQYSGNFIRTAKDILIVVGDVQHSGRKLY